MARWRGNNHTFLLISSTLSPPLARAHLVSCFIHIRIQAQPPRRTQPPALLNTTPLLLLPLLSPRHRLLPYCLALSGVTPSLCPPSLQSQQLLRPGQTETITATESAENTSARRTAVMHLLDVFPLFFHSLPLFLRLPASPTTQP